MAVDGLVVRFLEDEHRLAAGQLSFGRAADVVLDEDNLFLHRVVGRFVWWDGLWWVENLGEAVELQLHGGDGSLVRLPPGAKAPLTQPRASVRCTAGGLPYEVEAMVPASGGPGPPPVAASTGAPTSSYGEVALTSDEKALVVELARPFLLDPSAGPERLPGNSQVAAALGWSDVKLNRKLDYLCKRLSAAGVRNLQGGRRKLATNRRWVLVQHALLARMVTADDLRPS